MDWFWISGQVQLSSDGVALLDVQLFVTSGPSVIQDDVFVNLFFQSLQPLWPPPPSTAV